MLETSCPLCQQDNACGLLQNSDKPCWCMDEDFTAAVKAQLEVLGNREACICQRCVKRLRLANSAM